MEQWIEKYLIGVNADRSSTDAQKETIAQHIKNFVLFVAHNSQLKPENPNAAEEE